MRRTAARAATHVPSRNLGGRRRRPASANAVEQIGWWHPEAACESCHDPHARVAASGLKAPDLGGVHADALGEGFLGEAVLLAGGAEVGAEVRERVVVGHGPGWFDTGLIDPRTDESYLVIDRLRRAGMPTGPDDYLVPNINGGRISRQRVGEIVREAAEAASGQLVAKGLPPLPNTTPHTLRRTYISIALLANNFDVKWVMGQVGHADSKMTLDVYAQLEQRVDRSHGTSFDRLIAQARDQLDGLNGSPSGHNAEIEAADARGQVEQPGGDVADLQALPPMARPGLEPGTPRFSVVCSTN